VTEGDANRICIAVRKRARSIGASAWFVLLNIRVRRIA
jgi:hypothetical protein